jgi:H+/gluconate symporter-like permease
VTEPVALTKQGAQTRERIVFGLVLAVHFAVLYWPVAPTTGGIPVDKVVHAAIFGAVLWFGTRIGVPVWLLAGLLVIHAVASELIQDRLLAGRTGDPADVVADLSGVLIVTLVLWRRR